MIITELYSAASKSGKRFIEETVLKNQIKQKYIIILNTTSTNYQTLQMFLFVERYQSK